MGDKRALVLGGIGMVGGYLLKILLREKYYEEINILSRKPLSYDDDRLKVHIIDFDNLSTYKDIITADDIYCCLGTTKKKAGSNEGFYKVDYEYPVQVARFAKENGASQYFIITAIGANSKSSIFYNRVKGEVEEEIKSISFDAFHIFRPSLLDGERNEKRFGEDLGVKITSAFNFAMKGALKQYKPIKAEKVAMAMFLSAKQEQKGVFIHFSKEMQDIAI